jgi:RHS repeat-associated protein
MSSRLPINNSKYTYTYDLVNRLTSIDNSGTSGVLAVKFDYSYDGVGNLVTVADSIAGSNAGITSYIYDELNRITRLTQSGNGVVSKRIDMGYNAANRMTSLRRYRDDNLVVETSYTYDNQQRLTNLSHQKNTTTIASYNYSYDATSKLTQLVSSTDGTSNYTYDATNQLTGVDNTTQTDEAYSYDANGNRTNSGYQTGTDNRLLTDGVYNYEYDNEGNRTKRTEIATGQVTQYVWDYRNRLANALFKDTSGNIVKTVEYLYDVNNQRIGKKIDGAVTERYVLDRNQIALVFDGQGNQTHRYLYGTQIDEVLADETPTSMKWALADNQGTVRDLVDDSGNVVSHFSYDSFGNIVNPAGFDFRYGYTGREWDSETGQYYYRARYYDSGVGRFISEDPLGFDAGDYNLNRYVGNSSVNYTDPNGMYGRIVGGHTPLSGNRKISYRDSRGSYYVVRNNIQQVINASKSDPYLTIIYDVTNATIVYSSTQVGTVTSSNRSQVLAIRHLSGPDADNAGHIIGNQLGGSGTNLNNLFAQRGRGFNQPPGSFWRAFENRIRTNIDEELTEIPDPSICIPTFRPRRGHRTARMTVRLQYVDRNVRPVGVAANVTYQEPFLSRSSALPDRVNIPNP